MDSIESDDGAEIENVVKDSDTEFVAEDKTVISINGCMNQGNVDPSSSISVPEASICNLSMKTQDHDNETRVRKGNKNYLMKLESKIKKLIPWKLEKGRI